MKHISRLRVPVAIAASLLIAACDEIREQADPKPAACRSERTVEGWTVTAGLEKAQSGDLIINRWEARRNFSTFFGVRITLDTGESPVPTLQIWHDYKSGEFLMKMENESHFILRLKAQYAVSTANLPPEIFEELSRRPVRIEHTSHERKWNAYETVGLPEAIAAAKADLDEQKRRLAEGTCEL